MNRVLAALALTAAVGCAPASQEMSETQRAAVADTIRQQSQRFIDALNTANIDNFVALFTQSPDFIYVDGGNIYPTPQRLTEAGRNFVGSLRSFAGRWDPSMVVVFSPDGAAFTGRLHVEASDTTGRAIWTNGKIWSLVYRREGGEWKIVQAHEATVPPPRN